MPHGVPAIWTYSFLAVLQKKRGWCLKYRQRLQASSAWITGEVTAITVLYVPAAARSYLIFHIS